MISGIFDTLDLNEPYHKKAISKINWGKVEGKLTLELFTKVICNPDDCPYGYEECRREKGRRTDCYYWDIIYARIRDEN